MGVLIPGAQLVGELVAKATNGGEYRSETIDAMIGEGDIFLLAVVVDENGHIDIDGWIFSELGFHEAEIPNHGKQFDICFVDPVRDP